MDDEVYDINGVPVRVGTKVRVLKIDKAVLAELSEEEAAAVRSMEGEVLEVMEIDEWGGAWVEKWWRKGEDDAYSHSMGLGPTQMEVLKESKPGRKKR